MGRADNIVGQLQRIGAVARAHQQQRGGGENPFVIGVAALFVLFAAVAGAGGIGWVFHGAIVQNANFSAS